MDGGSCRSAAGAEIGAGDGAKITLDRRVPAAGGGNPAANARHPPLAANPIRGGKITSFVLSNNVELELTAALRVKYGRLLPVIVNVYKDGNNHRPGRRRINMARARKRKAGKIAKT